MTNRKILIVDDDDNVCQLLTLYLIKEKYEVSVCHNGKEAIKQIEESDFALVLLDIMMPEMDGYETLACVRKFSNVPVIMVSAKSEPLDKISGLNYGADDYVTKPFEPQELLARINAVFRRAQNISAPVKTESHAHKDLTCDDLFISTRNSIVRVGEQNIEMPPKEIELLYALAARPGQLFTREQLVDKVWGHNYQGDARTVDVHVKRIREKLGSGKNWQINTVWGKGYKFELRQNNENIN